MNKVYKELYGNYDQNSIKDWSVQSKKASCMLVNNLSLGDSAIKNILASKKFDLSGSPTQSIIISEANN